MDQTALIPFLIEMILGGFQGRLLGAALSLQRQLCRWLSNPAEPDCDPNCPEPSWATVIASWILTAILVSTPAAAWYLWLYDARLYSPVFALFSIAFFVANAFQRFKRKEGEDLIFGACQSARRLPVIVLFGVFGRKHPETDAFLKILKNRRINRLWSKFDRISVDFERDAPLAKKYGFESEKGVQIALFGKTAERVEVAGRNSLAGPELMQASTFAEWLRRIDHDSGSAAEMAEQSPG